MTILELLHHIEDKRDAYDRAVLVLTMNGKDEWARQNKVRSEVCDDILRFALAKMGGWPAEND